MICDDCKSNTDTEGYVKSIKIKRCPHCGSVYLGKWSEGPEQESEVVEEIMGRVLGVQKANFEITGNEYNRRVQFEGTSRQTGKSRRGEFFLHTSFATCPVCVRKRGNYYEAILQLRGERSELLDLILTFLVDLIDGASSKEVFLTKVERKREGYDLFVSSKQYTRTIARRAIERFGGTFKETSHLVGVKDGSELYRITVSIRIPSFQKNDVLRIGSRLYLVKSVKSDLVTLLDFVSLSLEKRRLQDLEQYSTYREGKDIKEASVLYTQGNTSYILDPFDYRERAVIDPKHSERIKVIKVDDEVIAVPSVRGNDS